MLFPVAAPGEAGPARRGKRLAPTDTPEAGNMARAGYLAPRERPRCLSPRPRDPDSVEGQRRLRARQQRRVPLLLRHRDQLLPDHRGRPRHPRRRGHRRVRGVALRVQRGLHLPRDRRGEAAGGAARPFERSLRDRALPRGRGARRGDRLVRARVRRAPEPPAGGDPRTTRSALERLVVSETPAA